MEASFSICSPSLFCILPALLKDFSHKSHIILHPYLYPWFNSLVAKTGDRMNKSVQKHFVADFKSYHLFPTIRDRPGLYILDVVPMTILRPDGHISGPQKCSTCKNDDCLHYMLPGPTDWWNHLMYSNLISLTAERRAIQ